MADYISVYPPAHNDTYVKATTYVDEIYYPHFATDPAKSVTGSAANNAWMSTTWEVETKFNIDLGESRAVSRLYLENFHYTGSSTFRGIREFELYGTNDLDAFANTTFSDLTDLTLLDSFEATRHPDVDVADPQYFLVSSPGDYRYYVIRILTGHGTVNVGFRRVELQITVETSNLVLPSIEAAGTGGGVGTVALPPFSVSGNSGGVGTVALPPFSVSSAGGGVGNLAVSVLSVSGSGRNTNLASIGGAIPYEITGGFEIVSLTPIQIGGTIPYTITGGFQMDRTEIGGTIPYEITGGLDIHSEILIGLSGIIPYTITGGFDVSPHIPVSLVGNIPYVLTGGFAVVSGVSDIDIEGTIPYTVTGGFGIKSRAAMEIEGTIPYTLTGGFTIDSGESCGSVLRYSEDTIC
ncbi:MAG: hypothetical protein WCY59_08070 [Anaerovoracaceae bacterium]